MATLSFGIWSQFGTQLAVRIGCINEIATELHEKFSGLVDLTSMNTRTNRRDRKLAPWLGVELVRNLLTYRNVVGRPNLKRCSADPAADHSSSALNTVQVFSIEGCMS